MLLPTGNLSVKERKIKVMNMLSGQCDLIKCCTEETLEAIRERYLVRAPLFVLFLSSEFLSFFVSLFDYWLTTLLSLR